MFDSPQDFAAINLYWIRRGKQGVLLVELTKSELLPHRTFKSKKATRDSSPT